MALILKPLQVSVSRQPKTRQLAKLLANGQKYRFYLLLRHPSVGEFWTHSGWNSTVEAVLAGLPTLTSSIFWDQFPNSKTVVEDSKIGWRVKSEAGDMNLMARKEIAEVVRSFMNEENSMVKEMRKRARELQRMCQSAIAEGGSSDTNLDCFIRKISGGDRPRETLELSTLT